LKTWDKQQLPIEEISAVLDGESTSAEADRNRLVSDPRAMQIFRHFQRIQTLITTLPVPEPSPAFTERVMDQVGGRRHTVTSRYVYAAAATILVIIGLAFYSLYPASVEPVSRPSAATDASPVSPLQTPVADEDALWLYLADTTDYYELSFSLTLIETIPEETLLSFLAASTLEEAPSIIAVDEDAQGLPEPYPNSPESADSSFTSVLDFVDMLDATEAIVLNEALRAALEEA